MLLRRIEVRDFGCIGRAQVQLSGGLNVLYGPNDLGKSTLAAAIRAALLLQHNSSGAREYIPWGTERSPEVLLDFEIDGRIWRVEKRFGYPSGGAAKLSWSNDGEVFTQQEEGRAVDGHIRTLLQWGIAQPGGRGGKHGLPTSFLASVLLGEQAVPYRLFETSLGADADDGGKDRLTEALSALAADPLYQDVLNAVQARVDEAYTAKGKQRSGKASPFAKVAAEIKVRRSALEDLERQVEQTDVVVSRLGELHGLGDRRLGELAVAREALEQAQEDRARATARDALAADVERTRGQLDAIERNKAEVDRLGRERREIAAQLPEAEARLAATLKAKSVAASALAQLGDGEGEAAVDPAAQLAVERGEASVRDAEATLGAATKAREALDTWAAANAESLEDRRAAQGAEAEMEALEVAVTAAQREADLFSDAARWRRREDAQQRVGSLKGRLAEFDLCLERASALDSEATQLRAKLEQQGLPSRETLTQWRTLGEQLAVAEAKLGGGVWLDVAVPDGAGTVAIDEQEARPLAGGETLEGRAQLRVEISDVGHLVFGAGSAAAAAEARDAKERWAQDVGAALQRLGAEDLTAVERRLEDAAVQSAAAKAKADEAQTQRRLAAERPSVEATLARAREELAGAADRCGDIDDAVAEASAADQTTAEIDDARTRAEAALEQHRERRRVRQEELSGLRSRAEVSAERAALAFRALESKPAAEGAEAPDADALTNAMETAVAEARAALTQAKRSLEKSVTAAASLAQRQRAARDTAREALAMATADHEHRADALRELRDAQAKADAALEVRREQLQGGDALALAETFARLSDALAAAPSPRATLADEELETLVASATEAELAADEASAEVRKQEGALAHVGGQVVRENAERAREALDAAVRREAEVELDYRAWKLLLETLREAENDEGTHLGRALAGEVAERFSALTAGRYGGLELGPDLEAKGLHTSTGEQPLERFSEGVKEQLATILRVSIAEHLQGALVLDDHLAQTDPLRAGWFRDLLAGAAERIQVVVLTCRPSEYLTGDEPGSGVIAQDVSDLVERSTPNLSPNPGSPGE